MLVDPETRAEQRIDDRVFSGSYFWGGRVDEDGLLSYSVSDDDRSGIWIARLSSGPVPRAAGAPPILPAYDLAPGPRGPEPRLRPEPPPWHIRTGARP